MNKKEGLRLARNILLALTLIVWFIGLWSVLCMGSELWVTDFIVDATDCSVFLNFFLIIFLFFIFGAWFIIPIILIWIIYLIVWLILREK